MRKNSSARGRARVTHSLDEEEQHEGNVVVVVEVERRR